MSQTASSSSATNTSTTSRGVRTGVLHVCADLNYGDPARETVDLAILCQRLGWRAMIASSGGSLVIDAERAAVKHIRIPLGQRALLSGWRSRLSLDALIQRERPALVHVHGPEATETAYRSARKHGVPILVDFTQPFSSDISASRLEETLKSGPAKIRVPTSFMAEYIAGQLHIDVDDIHLVSPGVDLQIHQANGISAERLHNLSRLWRLPEAATVILMPLPLSPGMGHEVLLDAIATMKHENVFTVMIGSDRQSVGYRSVIEQKITQLDLHGRVIMPEFCTDWPAAFWLAHALVLPNSIPRGQSLELLAAQAIGRPAIVSEVGANKQMVLDGTIAWIVPPDDHRAVAVALREAVHMDGRQRVTLGHTIRLAIEENFPQANWFNNMMDVYESLIFSTTRSTQPLRQSAA